jgi:signal transduction histidine kinase
MSDFALISDLWQGVLCLTALLGSLLLLNDLLVCLRLGRRWAPLLSAGLLLLSLAHIQIMMMNAYRFPHYPLGIHLKAVPTALLCLALLAFAVALRFRLGRWSRSHISAMSVKEAFDRLPAGLCYYLPGGRIKLSNASMDAVSQEISGAPMMDPEGLWRGLEGGSLPVSLRGGDAPMIRMKNGRVFSFRHRVLDTELGPVHELLAMDVSGDFALNEELAMKQAKARELNLRLKALLESIEYLTMSRELMQLKAELHDALGQSLLLSKRFLLDPGSTDPAEVRSAWLNDLRLLDSSRPESWQKPYYLPEKQAQALGVRLVIIGELPGENRLIPAVETALRVHITNVLRHAGGSRATVACRRVGDEWYLTLTNDGMIPRGPIREGGGLGNLRSRVEALGGSMEIDCAPGFRLQLRLPAGDGEFH